MEMQQVRTPSAPINSGKLRHLLFSRSSLAGNDIRGFCILDRNHKKIGTICEVYCDRDSLKPRYVEIILLYEKGEASIMYPYDCVKSLGDNGPAYITTSSRALVEHEEYDFERVMQSEGHELITFSETLEAESRAFFSDFELHNCA